MAIVYVAIFGNKSNNYVTIIIGNIKSKRYYQRGSFSTRYSCNFNLVHTNRICLL